MLFKVTFIVALLAAFVSAAPTGSSPDSVRIEKRMGPGPSGSVIVPTGNTNYKQGDAIHLRYKIVDQGTRAKTSFISVRLITFDGKVTYNANNITLAEYLAPAPGATEIDAYLRIPTLKRGEGVPKGGNEVAALQITETQVGTLGAAPFLAAAPRLVIQV